MLTKMRENKGFTLVELMIVVAIIGILAAVAVPFYQRYVQKARLTSLVFPAVHSIETNIAAYYAVSNQFPSNVAAYTRDADTVCLSNVNVTAAGVLNFDIDATSVPAACNKLANLHGLRLVATASVSANKIRTWTLSGNLAEELGLQ